MKILIAEDERKVGIFIKNALEEAGFVVDNVITLSDLLTTIKTNKYDALILDRLLQGDDSLNEINTIRQLQPNIKILVLSALSDVEDKVEGLTEGADDYLGKPFHVSELIARIRAITRRGATTASIKKDVITYKDLKINLSSQRVFRGDKRIDLTGKEFRILCLLSRHPGQVFSKTQILDQVWDLNHYPGSNVVEVSIANLRLKIDKDFEKQLIHNKRGVGYWFGES
ncbi:MAG: DNA-binding response regulator [Deltaproteobacteria bacterium CG07_land_8_20_14_0_80_38_7]|nr:MAG: DNA-binding response regulator [Deltaproteobacteria bacterium CG07_land_8_20_14_0_80_38_7]